MPAPAVTSSASARDSARTAASMRSASTGDAPSRIAGDGFEGGRRESDMARLFRSGLRSKWERSYARAAHGRKRFERETTNDESRATGGGRRATSDARPNGLRASTGARSTRRRPRPLQRGRALHPFDDEIHPRANRRRRLQLPVHAEPDVTRERFGIDTSSSTFFSHRCRGMSLIPSP